MGPFSANSIESLAAPSGAFPADFRRWACVPQRGGIAMLGSASWEGTSKAFHCGKPEQRDSALDAIAPARWVQAIEARGWLTAKAPFQGHRLSHSLDGVGSDSFK